MSVSSNFTTFCNKLKITASDISTISIRYKQITKRLNIDFWGIDSDTKNSLYVGSYGRNTDIVTSDIDMLMVLPYATYEKYNNYKTNGQSQLLQAVKNSIATTYPQTNLGADGQVVQVKFSDGIDFEVVPCFLNKDDSYTYPDSNNGGSWKVTKPRPEIKAIGDLDKTTNGNLKNLCKMVRAWKHKHNVPMGGLLIDTLVHRFLKDWEHKDKSYAYYDWLSRDFFKYLSEQDETQNYWLAVGSSQYIWRKGRFESKAKTAYNLSLEAIEYQSKKQEFSEKLKWREIYGTKFPS
jgi:hypothetical protein